MKDLQLNENEASIEKFFLHSPPGVAAAALEHQRKIIIGIAGQRKTFELVGRA